MSKTNGIVGLTALTLTGKALTLEDLSALAKGRKAIELCQQGLDRMAQSRALVDDAIRNRTPVYGITTGLGARSGEALDEATLAEFSVKTVRARSHAVGEHLTSEEVRAVLLARLNGLMTGHSGATPEVARYLCDVLNAGLVPVSRRIGSIGGGDLVINASIARALLGEGEMQGPDGSIGPAKEVLRKAGFDPLNLAPRDGLALANHTGFSAGVGALATFDTTKAFDVVQAACCLTMEGFCANLSPLNPKALAIKPLPGQAIAAHGMERWLKGSQLWQSGHARRLQDPLSIRNAVQIHGGLALAVSQARDIIEIELNGAGDNPAALIESKELVSCGAYHTTELALALESLARAWQHVSMAQLARIARMMSPQMTELPMFLAQEDSGSSGFAPLLKVAEHLAAEVVRRSAPQPVWPSISANGIEDCLTSAPTGVNTLIAINDNVWKLTAIELIVATQAIDLRGTRADLAPPLQGVYDRVRSQVAPLEGDRPLGEEIEALTSSLQRTALSTSA